MSEPTPFTTALAYAEMAAQAVRDGDVDQEIESLWMALRELGISPDIEPEPVVVFS